MSDFSEFYRFKKQVKDLHTCRAVELWFNMPEEIKESLRESWRLEDAPPEKQKTK